MQSNSLLKTRLFSYIALFIKHKYNNFFSLGGYMLFDLDMIKKVYSELPDKIEKAKQILNRPLTLSEKILYSHCYLTLGSKIPIVLFSGIR